jgi:hypothetical protein
LKKIIFAGRMDVMQHQGRKLKERMHLEKGDDNECER